MRKAAFVTTPLDQQKIETILELGFNEICVNWKNYNKDFADQLRTNDVKVFAEIGLFVGKEWWEKYPDSRPVDRQGNLMSPIHWYHGVCPNHPGVRRDQLANIDRIIHEFDVDGIYLDFVRYPCHWEEVRSAEITEYCFCDHCREKFKTEVGGTMAGEQWIAWKCKQITNFAKIVHDRIHHSQRAIKLAIFGVPWKAGDFGSGIRRIIGQDFTELSEVIDTFCMMAYHQITDNPVEWINEVVSEVAEQMNRNVFPAVQSVPLPKHVTAETFAASLKISKHSPSAGVMVFHLEDMLQDQKKVQQWKALMVPES